MESRLPQAIARGSGQRRARAGAADLAGEQIRGERLGGRVGGVEDHQPVFAEQAFQPRGERGHEPAPVRVRAAEIPQHLGREIRLRQGRGQRVESRLDPAAETYRGGGGAGPRVDLQGHGRECLVGVEHAAGPDLVEIVVFRVDPEDRDRGDAEVALDASGQPDRGDRLQERIQRPSEEARLLARDHRDRPGVVETRGGVDRRLRRPPGALLRTDHAADGGRVPVGLRAGGDRGPPSVVVSGIAGEERLKRVEIGDVLGGQPLDAGEFLQIDG